MWKELCEANANHYVEHPHTHLAIGAVYGVGAVIAVSYFIKKITKTQENPYL